VTRGLDEAHPGQELGVTGHRLEVEAGVVILDVRAGERPVEPERELLLGRAADQPGPGVLEQPGVARVVEVQVREDHVVQVGRGQPELLQP
jgi:hypothetical protein